MAKKSQGPRGCRVWSRGKPFSRWNLRISKVSSDGLVSVTVLVFSHAKTQHVDWLPVPHPACSGWREQVTPALLFGGEGGNLSWFPGSSQECFLLLGWCLPGWGWWGVNVLALGLRMPAGSVGRGASAPGFEKESHVWGSCPPVSSLGL